MYKKMYLILFQAITDALRAMEAKNYGDAEALLKEAQCKAEEVYMDGEEE